MGFLLQARGKLDEAEALFRRALEGMERVLGLNDPKTQSARQSLAILQRKRGKVLQSRHGKVKPNAKCPGNWKKWKKCCGKKGPRK